jgi:hypothetical protein
MTSSSKSGVQPAGSVRPFAVRFTWRRHTLATVVDGSLSMSIVWDSSCRGGRRDISVSSRGEKTQTVPTRTALLTSVVTLDARRARPTFTWVFDSVT